MRRNTRKTWAAIASVAAVSLLASACSSDSDDRADPAESGDGSKSLTLTVATFNDFGYTDEFLKEYTDANPGIKVVHQQAAEATDARTNMTTRLASGGEGLADIEAIEIDWMPELSQIPDAFVDISSPAIEGRWLPWKEDQGRTSDGTLIGYGTDIGPEAICYRQDLVEAAGLPSDPEGFAEFLGGQDATWDDYFKAGQKFVKKSDSAWFDSANATFQGMIGQVAAAYEDPSTGDANDLESNTEVKGLYEKLLAEAPELSAGMNQWEGDWDSAFQNDGFATMLCPAWMTGPIEERAGGVDGWNVADVFPGGGGNWGGSFLTIPAKGKNIDEAKKLAEWLTAPEQQIKAFASAGTFPSQVEAHTSDVLLEATNSFFNDAPVGAIFSARAKALDEVAPAFKGPNYFAIHETVQDAITRVDVDKTHDAAGSWQDALTAFAELGL